MCKENLDDFVPIEIEDFAEWEEDETEAHNNLKIAPHQIESRDDGQYAPAKENKVCKYCGQAGLHWQQNTYSEWRLHYPNNDLHTCRNYHSPATV